jgi:aldehyde dehydrogenase (NAD+)
VRGATRDSYLTRNEVFGPVLTVVEIDSFEDAIATVNDCEYGLSAAVYTRDVNLAMTAVHAIDTGIVYVNAPTIGAEIHLPFGGTKHTGNGYREAGRRGLEQFSETKSVYIDFSGRLQKAQIDNRDSIEATDV